ncbi:hypothetical protein DACRYDRAFT_86016 [Dacryopinax primogenitus]|uniref:Protein DOM34 homolog n=1 Tax=Dacryopinax primogenitus (strain DJM 731) TaxID=1858805 RepID=M5GGX1_DACPD|nr:uncharacterized protein DACRYDRAFT_86016 [Dacryopinax primogenitus]EJU06228.1 hypothetical protein DACRYDRAFT_86016 [Dacryopinax primogenitus]
MKLVNKHIDKDGKGYVTLRPEEDEDMWHIYNLIQVGDEVRAPAIRRVQNTTTTGSVSSERIRLNLTLEVTRVEFSPGASASTAPTPGNNTGDTGTASLQISGRVTSENQYVKMGAFHTLDLEANRDFKLGKEEWDSVALERLQEACVEGRGADVGAVVCGEGTAAICLLSEHMTVIRQRIEVPVPRKRVGSTTLHEKEQGLNRFYSTLYAALLRHLPIATLRVIVIASPGFVRDAVYDYIFAEATRTNNRTILSARSKFIRVHITSPHVHSLVEVLRSPEVSSQLRESKFAREGIALDKFFKMLANDEMRAWYGPEHVRLAAERGAVGTLLISDELFRSNDLKERKKYVELVERVRQGGGEALIFSSMHESGQQLNQLTGVAAILTFPLDVEVVEQEEKEAKEEAEKEAKEEAAVNGA